MNTVNFLSDPMIVFQLLTLGLTSCYIIALILRGETSLDKVSSKRRHSTQSVIRSLELQGVMLSSAFDRSFGSVSSPFPLSSLNAVSSRVPSAAPPLVGQYAGQFLGEQSGARNVFQVGSLISLSGAL